MPGHFMLWLSSTAELDLGCGAGLVVRSYVSWVSLIFIPSVGQLGSKPHVSVSSRSIEYPEAFITTSLPTQEQGLELSQTLGCTMTLTALPQS